MKIPGDLSIPAFLRRPLTSQAKSVITRAIKDQGGRRRLEPTSGPSSISAGHALNLDETGKALLQEINRAKELRKKKAFEHLRELAEAKRREKLFMSTHQIGPKEAALQASRASTVPPPKKTPEQLAAAIRDLNGKAKKSAPMHSAGAEAMRKARAEKSAKAKSPKAAKAKALVASAPAKKSNGEKKPLMQIAEDMLTTLKFVSQDEINEAWKRAGGKSPSVNIDALLARYRKREGGKPNAKLIEQSGKFRFV